MAKPEGLRTIKFCPFSLFTKTTITPTTQSNHTNIHTSIHSLDVVVSDCGGANPVLLVLEERKQNVCQDAKLCNLRAQKSDLLSTKSP